MVHTRGQWIEKYSLPLTYFIQWEQFCMFVLQAEISKSDFSWVSFFFSRLHVSSPYQKDDHSAIYRIINNSRLLPSLRDIVSCRRAAPLFVFAFLIFNWLIERQAEVCRLLLQCYRTKYSGQFFLLFIFFFSPKIEVDPSRFACVCCFCSSRKSQ